MRNEKSQQEIKNSILNYKLRKSFWLEALKFSSSVTVGIAASFLVDGKVVAAMYIGIPSFLIYFICLLFQSFQSLPLADTPAKPSISELGDESG